MIRFFQKGGVNGRSQTPSSVNVTGANEKVVGNRRYSPDRVYVGQSFPGNRSVYARKVGGGLEPHGLSDFAPFNPAYETGRFMNNMVNHVAEPFVRTGKVLGDAVELTGHGFANGARMLNKALRMAYTDTPAYQGGGTVLNSNLNEREREIITNQALFNAGLGGIDYGLGDVSNRYVPAQISSESNYAPTQPYSESNYLPNNVGYVPIDASLTGHGEEVLPQANPTPLNKAQLKAQKNKVRNDIKELRRIPSNYRDKEVLEAKKQELKMIKKGINNPSYKVYNPSDYSSNSVRDDEFRITGTVYNEDGSVDRVVDYGEGVELKGKSSYNSLSSRQKSFRRVVSQSGVEISSKEINDIEKYVTVNGSGYLTMKSGAKGVPSNISKYIDKINAGIAKADNEKYASDLEAEAKVVSDAFTFGSYDDLKEGNYGKAAAKMVGAGVLHGALGAWTGVGQTRNLTNNGLTRSINSLNGQKGNYVKTVNRLNKITTADDYNKARQVALQFNNRVASPFNSGVKYPLQGQPAPFNIQGFRPDLGVGSNAINPAWVNYLNNTVGGITRQYNVLNSSLFSPAMTTGAMGASQLIPWVSQGGNQ